MEDLSTGSLAQRALDAARAGFMRATSAAVGQGRIAVSARAA